MLSKPPITGITEKVPNLYTLTMAVAKRARQIASKENEIMIQGHEKPVSIAANDVYAGNVIVLDPASNHQNDKEEEDENS